MNSFRNWAVLVIFILICFIVAAVGSQFTPSTTEGGWYESLQKPSFNPPSPVFGPVWTFLYFTMAVAAWMVWRSYGARGVTTALVVFFIQLAFNGVWSIFFFGLRNPGLAFLDLVILWALILATIILFWRKSTFAGILLLPYILWVSFAGVLNFFIWRLNA